MLRWIFGVTIAGAVRLSTLNATTSHDDTHAMRPMISTGTTGTTRTWIADLGLASHLARQHH